jgi:BirA family biotin operon repressor/biotin-[acetyl-CoA-carboxylase] ligase
MIVLTDNIEYADAAFTDSTEWHRVNPSDLEEKLGLLIKRLFSGGPLHQTTVPMEGCWQYLFLAKEAPSSQYDVLVEMGSQKTDLPDGIICVAGTGRNFHGQRGRAWTALPGNIHLSAFLSPRRRIDKFHIGFSLLAAVSVIDTIDSLAPLTGKAKIKWINDVLIEEAKVAGFLANTSSSGGTVSAAVLGIGLNVDTTPLIEGDEVAPAAASLRDFVPDRPGCSRKRILHRLLQDLDSNYRLLLSGKCDRLLATYRERSAVIGRRVRIVSDEAGGHKEETASGRVLGIGENLELLLDGETEPVTRGRLILLD